MTLCHYLRDKYPLSEKRLATMAENFRLYDEPTISQSSLLSDADKIAIMLFRDGRLDEARRLAKFNRYLDQNGSLKIERFQKRLALWILLFNAVALAGIQAGIPNSLCSASMPAVLWKSALLILEVICGVGVLWYALGLAHILSLRLRGKVKRKAWKQELDTRTRAVRSCN